MLKQPINFVYAAFVITLIGGSFTMYILKISFEQLSNPYLGQQEFVATNHSSGLN